MRCQAEDQGGYACCPNTAVLQTKRSPKNYYCIEHITNKHVGKEAEVEAIMLQTIVLETYISNENKADNYAASIVELTLDRAYQIMAWHHAFQGNKGTWCPELFEIRFVCKWPIYTAYGEWMDEHTTPNFEKSDVDTLAEVLDNEGSYITTQQIIIPQELQGKISDSTLHMLDGFCYWSTTIDGDYLTRVETECVPISLVKDFIRKYIDNE